MAIELSRSQLLRSNMPPIDVESQKRVLAWADYGNSVEKIEFMKAFLRTLNEKECKAVRDLIGHRLPRNSTKQRKWIGPQWEKREVKKSRKGSTAESLPTSLESRPAVEPWWRKWSIADVVAVDVEEVSIKELKGISKGRAAKISVVDSKGMTVFRSDVYHEPGSFDTSPKAVAISGIKRNDLVGAPKWNDSLDTSGNVVKLGVNSMLREALRGKLVITCDGFNDFLSMDIEEDDYSGTFDLQLFYRRPHPECQNSTQPMSLRDMYFFHFHEDFQHEKPHDCVKDAVATMKVFNAYRKLKLHGLGNIVGDPSTRDNTEGFDFSDTPNLKSKERNGFNYCKFDNLFKKVCRCEYCKRYK